MDEGVEESAGRNADEEGGVNPLEEPVIAKSLTIAQNKSDTNSVSGGVLPSRAIVKSNDTANSSNIGPASISIPEFNNERELAIDSTSVFKNNNATKKFPTNAVKNGNQTKNKISLMGLNNIDTAKTEFSAAGLHFPTYGKKKKKKRKKSKST